MLDDPLNNDLIKALIIGGLVTIGSLGLGQSHEGNVLSTNLCLGRWW